MKDLNTQNRKKMIREMGKGYGWNFLESFMYFILAVIVGSVIIVKLVFPLIQRAVDIEALRTCEDRGDCSEVIRDINN